MGDQRPIALAREFEVPSRGLPGSLLESMQYVNRLRKGRHVHDAVFEVCMNANLPDPRTNAGKRLPVQRLVPLLDAPQLKPRNTPGIRREGPDVTSRGSEPKQGLVDHA